MVSNKDRRSGIALVRVLAHVFVPVPVLACVLVVVCVQMRVRTCDRVWYGNEAVGLGQLRDGMYGEGGSTVPVQFPYSSRTVPVTVPVTVPIVKNGVWYDSYTQFKKNEIFVFL